MAVFILDKAYVIVLVKYSDFEDVFSKEFAVELPKHIEINTNVINLEEGK